MLRSGERRETVSEEGKRNVNMFWKILNILAQDLLNNGQVHHVC